MDELASKILELKKRPIKKAIDRRLLEFLSLGKLGNEEWFCELCFCILTANSRAKTAIKIQQKIGKGFLDFEMSQIADIIRNEGHRFHNTKARFIVEARKFSKIKDIILEKENKREWLVGNVKGIGIKEASHFLRNVGFFDYAIVDRHIVNLLYENGLCKNPYKKFRKKDYLKIEKILLDISKKVSMTLGELDLYLWYMKTGSVLK
ncbi:N-glycosylase/DNA lyase [Candidatus Pacearchaeota archaeon]|nr:MAG: N-glycosylase/DNA lyase [Candidatus Pacearchaeota archaeon]